MRANISTPKVELFVALAHTKRALSHLLGKPLVDPPMEITSNRGYYPATAKSEGLNQTELPQGPHSLC